MSSTIRDTSVSLVGDIEGSAVIEDGNDITITTTIVKPNPEDKVYPTFEPAYASFTAEANSAYAVDMSDNVSKTMTIPVLSNGDWVAVKVLSSTGDGTTSKIYLVAGDPWEDGDVSQYYIESKSNATYILQKINGKLTIVSGVGEGGSSGESSGGGTGDSVPEFNVVTEDIAVGESQAYSFDMSDELDKTATVPALPNGAWFSIRVHGTSHDNEAVVYIDAVDPWEDDEVTQYFIGATRTSTYYFQKIDNKLHVVDGIGETGGSADKIDQINNMLVGSYLHLPPQASEWNAGVIEVNGALLSKAAYPVLWGWVQSVVGTVTAAEYDAIVAASPNAMCSRYADVDANTFRIPTTGTGGFSRFLGAAGEAPLGGTDGGFAGQVEEHQHATPIRSEAQNVIMHGYNVTDGDAPFGSVARNLFPNNPAYSYITGGQTASNTSGTWALTSAEQFNNSGITSPDGDYKKLFLYTGNISSNLPTPRPDWLAQQDANTAAIGELTSYPTDWMNGQSLLTANATCSVDELLYRWEDAKTFHVKGIVRTNGANFLDATHIINLPKYNRRATYQFGPSTVSAVDGSNTYIRLNPNTNAVDIVPNGTTAVNWVMFDLHFIIED